MNHEFTAEAQAARKARQLLRKSQADDPLAERVRIIAFWRKCAETNRAYTPHNGAWWWPFLVQPGYRRLLMPRLRADRDERGRASKAQYAAELRESAQRFAQNKAERAAAKARASQPQQEFFA